MKPTPCSFRCLSAVLLLALGLATASADDDEERIRILRAQSNEAIAQHDAEAVGAFLDSDYVITISTGAIERSREEHVRSFAEHFEQYPDVLYVRTPAQITLSDAYPLALEEGTWVGSRTTANGQLTSGGQYSAAWRKTDRGWKIYSELFVALYCQGKDC